MKVVKKYEYLQEQVIKCLDLSEEVVDEELQVIIYEVLRDYGKREYLSIQEQIDLGKELFNTFRKLDIIQELLENEAITEIMINGTSNIFIEEQGLLRELDKRFWSKGKLEDVIQHIVSGTNRIVNEKSPIADARLEDGSRVNIVLHPVALNGPIVTIRKFAKERITMQKLLEWGTVSSEAVDFLKQMVHAKYNIFISGGTGSGKTTFLNALSEYIPSSERVITIEDNAELQLQGISNLVRLEARIPNVEGEGEVTIQDLIRASLRMRPDRIIVGEVRGKEIYDMLTALTSGHDGSLSSAHASSIKDMLNRLETLAILSCEIPIQAVRRQLASGIDLMIHVGRARDGTRKVMEITEILGYQEEEIQVQVLFQFREEGEVDGKIQGKLEQMNSLFHREKLMAAGYKNI